ncbi:hypothetical protein ORI99_00040 [Alishewanella sp. SMS9]|nr:hypothetical protein [Alishewanella sp. SMS9]
MSERTIRIRVDAGDSGVQVKKLDDSMRSAGQQADKLNDELLGLSNSSMPQLSKTAQGVQQATKGASASLTGFGRNAGQAGIQIQQFVGQVTAGQSAVVAFSQQSADLGFVLGVPLAGAIISIAAAVASVFAPSLMDSKSAVDDLDSAIERLGNTALLTDSGIAVLSDELASLAKNSEIAAQARIASALLDARDAAKAAAAGIEEAFDNGVVDAFLFDITALTDEIRGGLNSSLVGLTANALRPARLIGEAFGETGKEATALGIEIGELIVQLEKVGDTESVDALQNRLSELALGSAATNKEALKFIGSIQEFFSKARDAAEITEFLTQAQKDLGSALQTNTETSANLINRLNQELAIQKAELNDGAEAAELLRIAFANGNESIKELPKSLRETAVELFNTKQQIKALAEEERKAEQARRDAARQAEREDNLAERDQQRIDKKIALLQLETQTIGSELALQQAVRQGFLTQEQADLDLQTAAKIQKAITERDLLLAEKSITDEQVIAAETAFQEQMTAISQQYAERRIEVERLEKNTRIGLTQDFANAAIGVISAFGSKSFQAQKNQAIATGIVNIAGGVAKALNNPYPANLGFAAQVAAQGAGLISTIRSTNLGSGGGNIDSISTATALPTTPTAAPTVGSFEITGLSELQRQLDELDNDEVLPVSFTRRLVASLSSVQRLEGGE